MYINIIGGRGEKNVYVYLKISPPQKKYCMPTEILEWGLLMGS